jgi:hypothetical protein
VIAYPKLSVLSLFIRSQHHSPAHGPWRRRSNAIPRQRACEAGANRIWPRRSLERSLAIGFGVSESSFPALF